MPDRSVLSSSQNAPRKLLKGDFEIDSSLSSQWVEALANDPRSMASPKDFLQMRSFHESYLGAPSFFQSPADFMERFKEETINQLTSWTNLPANVTAGAFLADSTYNSMPATWRAKLAGGEFELYNANPGRANPRMFLTIKNARLRWVNENFNLHPTRGYPRIPVGRAQSLEEALEIAEVGRLKLIPKRVYQNLPVRGIYGGRGFGYTLALIPTAIEDANNSGLFVDPTNKSAWKNFAVHSAEDQTGNLLGLAASELAVGLLEGAVGAMLLPAALASAPVLILVGLTVGVLATAGFNAKGWNKSSGSAVRKWID